MAEFGFASDGTLKEMVEVQKVTNNILQVMMAEQMATIATDLQAIKHIVQQGAAESIFSVGDQIIDDWTEEVSQTTYSAAHNVVAFGDVETEDGESVPGMFLQWHYAAPISMPFDAREAFYYAEDGLSAGTYCFTFGSTWGSYIISGNMYEFTLENDVPEGGQLVFEAEIYTSAAAGTNVLVYASSSATSATESAALSLVTESSGTNLGSIVSNKENGAFNSIQRAIYGSNRWSRSALRQYLNSSAGIGEWWTPQSNFDRPPAQLSTYPGFMSGYDSAFLSAIQKVKVTTALNTLSDGGGSEDTYDYFFPASLEQMYITSQSEGVEGDYFPYWKRAIGGSETAARGTAGAVPITYAIETKTTAQAVILRSANTAAVYSEWRVSDTGSVGASYASTQQKAAPVCVVC
ncbi:MAG: DUF6273 domain-containing protein [Clostridia bacterium]|nr:DUF6273 domain-containing protein [Clostridia bacterium]